MQLPGVGWFLGPSPRALVRTKRQAGLWLACAKDNDPAVVINEWNEPRLAECSYIWGLQGNPPLPPGEYEQARVLLLEGAPGVPNLRAALTVDAAVAAWLGCPQQAGVASTVTIMSCGANTEVGMVNLFELVG
ncbi:hypothetical protein WJX72_012268 [[Myrmecia] bisecta]|uniref:Uncharacterized protein n=1 Tax=[Myrmecia] bisecta TaxID=41462 RepID=A0AAW1PMF9_9CHLO